MEISTLATVTALMQQRLSVPTESLRPEQTLEEIGVDSLALIEFMFDIENALGISFETEPVSVVTVQDVINLVDQALASRGDALKPQHS